MKQCLCFLCSICFISNLLAQKYTLSGIVTDTKRSPIEYVTVVLMNSDSAQVAGIATDARGEYSFAAPAGTYILAFHYLGYENSSRSVELSGNKRFEPVVMTASSLVMKAVEVKTQLITREADRFVMNVAGSPSSIGKDALEMLKSAPGVWVKQDDIMINGKGGSRIMINDRLLNMTADELNVYLKNIKAEDIQKIEIIPMTGADYDANTQSGIIKITLKRQRRDGIEGGISTSYMVADHTFSLRPSFNINYRQNKLSLYTNFDFSRNKNSSISNEKVDYLRVDRMMVSQTTKIDNGRYFSNRTGAIYEITPSQSVGFEFGVGKWNNSAKSDGTSSMTSAGQIDNLSSYDEQNHAPNYHATINYILKLDTLGSTFKLIGDMNTRKSNSTNNYFNRASDPMLPEQLTDTTYRSLSNVDYGIYSATADLELYLSRKTKIKTGLKFNYNHMDNSALYEGLHQNTWVTNPVQTGADSYLEHIGAAYAILNTTIKKVAVSAGLRVEYTNMVPSSDKDVDMSVAEQNYFSFFPNVNISVPLNEKGSNSLVFAYSRRISRPRLWALNPQRMQLSEYAYATGNPRLRPTFTNDYSITGVLASKYSLNVGAKMVNDGITQMASYDVNNPQVLVYRHENLPREWQYYVNLNAPITITKWWSLNINATGLRQVAHLNDQTQTNNTLFTNMSTTFTIPKEFFIEMQGFYMSKIMSGNMYLDPMYNMNISFKKRLFKGAVTVSAALNNFLGDTSVAKISINEADYTKRAKLAMTWDRRQYEFSLRYNFKSGITFKSKNVESDSDNTRMDGEK